MKGIVTYSIGEQTLSVESELALGQDGAWHPVGLPAGAAVKGVKLMARTIAWPPWQTWLDQCAEGLDGETNLLAGDEQ